MHTCNRTCWTSVHELPLCGIKHSLAKFQHGVTIIWSFSMSPTIPNSAQISSFRVVTELNSWYLGPAVQLLRMSQGSQQHGQEGLQNRPFYGPAFPAYMSISERSQYVNGYCIPFDGMAETVVGKIIQRQQVAGIYSKKSIRNSQKRTSYSLKTVISMDIMKRLEKLNCNSW
jgi:hypothetical protein